MARILEMTQDRHADSIVRPTSLSSTHKIIFEGLNTCETTWEISERIKTSVVGAILGFFFDISRLCSGHFWHKEEGCEGFSDFQCSRILHWCFIKEIRRLTSYPRPHLLQNIVNPKLDPHNENGGVEYQRHNSRAFRVYKTLCTRGGDWEISGPSWELVQEICSPNGHDFEIVLTSRGLKQFIGALKGN